jgi:hypothetical protein
VPQERDTVEGPRIGLASLARGEEYAQPGKVAPSADVLGTLDYALGGFADILVGVTDIPGEFRFLSLVLPLRLRRRPHLPGRSQRDNGKKCGTCK